MSSRASLHRLIEWSNTWIKRIIGMMSKKKVMHEFRTKPQEKVNHCLERSKKRCSSALQTIPTKEKRRHTKLRLSDRLKDRRSASEYSRNWRTRVLKTIDCWGSS